MRVIVCGGRDYADADMVAKTLDQLHAGEPIDVLMHGAAPGADTLASAWAAKRGIPQISFPALWHVHGRSAGPRRNAKMLADGRPGLVVAFPGGRGTADMISQAERAGVPVGRASQ